MSLCCVFFQAEDGIRDIGVTGVQTCALPIYVGAIELPPPCPQGRSAGGSAEGHVPRRAPARRCCRCSSAASTSCCSSPARKASSMTWCSACRVFCPVSSSLFARSEEHTSELQSRQYLVCR